jgi:hypothetical protein
MKITALARAIGATAATALPLVAHAVSFDLGSVSGDFNSTISSGFGLRMKNPSPDYLAAGNVGGPAGTLSPVAFGDQGDLNYAKHDFFTGYLKGSHELMLKFPEEFTFMGRVNWLRDFTATNTTGYVSGAGVPLAGPSSDGLTDEARKEMRFKGRLLDLWVSKSFQLGEQQARVRVGNQVVSWGESLFIPGGINQTNAVDINRLSQPGTQLKEAVLPAPIASFATGLGHGVNMEAYVQGRWNANYMPPVGSYWSLTHFLGPGSTAYGANYVDPKNGGQWGVSMRWQPENVQANIGLYAMNYHDKMGQISFARGEFDWVYPENRKMYGISANFPVGDWAVGTELSYRPKDAVALNSMLGCTSQGGNCWVDEKRLQWHLTGLLSLTPANARGFLDLIGADGATFLGELAVIRFPGLKQSYGGDPVAAGGWAWGNEIDPTAAPIPTGTKTSSGIALDFSVAYDGTIIPGWMVTPEIFYSRALSGRTPNMMATFMKGAQSASLIVTFAQNPLKWQFGVNYGKFWGGSSVYDQPFRDRDFFGAYASYNF